MERNYNELEESLQVVFGGFTQGENDKSEEITTTVIDELGTELVYGFSFVRVHDANYLIGSCYGGGYEFLECIDEDSITIEPVVDNFKEQGLTLISVDSGM